MFGIRKLSHGRIIFVAMTSLVFVSSPARAEYPEFVKKACKSDFKKYCPSYDIDSKALRACIRAVADDLKPRCVEALERNGERRRK